MGNNFQGEKMKKLVKIVFSVLLAAALAIGVTACKTGNGDGGNDDPPVSYSVTFVYNYEGRLTDPFAQYSTDSDGLIAEPEDEPSRPASAEASYTFKGWYKDAAATEEFDFGKKLTADTTVYAGWNETPLTPSADQWTVKFYYNYAGAPSDGVYKTVNVAKNGKVTRPSPDPARPESTTVTYTFKNWYTTAQCTTTFNFDNSITANTDVYAGWNETPKSVDNGVTVTAFGGYEEGAYIEFDEISGVSSYKVSYKKSGDSSYTALTGDDAKYLVRELGGNSGKWRADVVGLSAGNYTVKVEAGSASAEKSVTVTSYDRSGYANWKSGSGVASQAVGAYTNNGTPKSNARIIYVTEENKNTVTLDGNKGIVKILQNAGTSKPLIVRIVGTVGSATWKANDNMDYKKKNKLESGQKITADQVVDINGTKIPISLAPLDQKSIKDTYKYNVLDTSVYSEITGLSSKMSYDSKKEEWDSYWNMCDVSGVKDVTVEGIGTDARIFQWGFTWDKCSSIEVRNLTFEDYTEDACSFEGNTSATELKNFGSESLWVHNNTFLQGKNYWDVSSEQDKHDGDGTTDFKGVTNVTVSYNHYYNNHKTGLVGGDDKHMSANLTFHHNFYDQAWSRLPLGRQANMHMYNNYYLAGKDTSYFISARANAFIFVENCYFDVSAKSSVSCIDVYSTKDFSDGKRLGYVKIYNCTLTGAKEYTDSNREWAVTAGFIRNVTERTEAINEVTYEGTKNGTCRFGQNFDTDSASFYYDSSAKKTLTQSGFAMLTADQVKTQVKDLAGVHKN